MRKLAPTCILLINLTFGHAQNKDSTRIIYQELGFNLVSLLQQIKALTPSETQLPYDVMYNIYYRNLVGLRGGLGLLSTQTLTDIEGQKTPRSTTTNKLNARVGVSYNFGLFGKLSFNCFVDRIWLNNEVVTINTSTVQVFPDPIVTRTVRSSDKTHGSGWQGGAGLKFDFWKKLSLYTELAIVYTDEKNVVEDLIRESGTEDVVSKKTTRFSGTGIALPATIYLVLRF